MVGIGPTASSFNISVEISRRQAILSELRVFFSDRLARQIQKTTP